jgi:TonB family protein
MRNYFVVAIFFLLTAGYSNGQQTSLLVPKNSLDLQSDRVKVYSAGPDVTAPELLPLDLSPFHDEKCGNKLDGKVELALLVDTEGKPRNIVFDEPFSTDLEKLALKIVSEERFKPGIHDGIPVVVAQSVEVELKACVDEVKDDSGKKKYRLQLMSQPEQRFGPLPQPPKEAILTTGDAAGLANSIDGSPLYRAGGEVSAPVALNNVQAEFSDEARQAKYQGICVLSLIVDEKGKPQNIRVVRKLGMGLDEKAIEAVSQYHFKPAMRNGVPVPVKINVEVNFRLYNY